MDAMRVGAVAAALALCAASATPYQESGFLRGGYDQMQVGPGTWAVHVKVNGYTDRGTAMAYAYRRAGEICPTGYDMVDGETSSKMYATMSQNSVDVVEKPEVTLIVKCHSPVECVSGCGGEH